MTILTGVAAHYVVTGLAGGSDAIVATEAGTGNAGVIKRGRNPATGAVATLAGVAALYMIPRFTRCSSTVVA